MPHTQPIAPPLLGIQTPGALAVHVTIGDGDAEAALLRVVAKVLNSHTGGLFGQPLGAEAGMPIPAPGVEIASAIHYGEELRMGLGIPGGGEDGLQRVSGATQALVEALTATPFPLCRRGKTGLGAGHEGWFPPDVDLGQRQGVHARGVLTQRSGKQPPHTENALDELEYAVPRTPR